MLEDQIRDALDRRVDVRDAFRGLPAEALNEMVEDIAKIVSAARGEARAELEAEVARFQAERARDIAATRRDLLAALELPDTALTADDEIRAAWAEVMQCAEVYPILRRSMDMGSRMISDASAALEAAGFPHVDGVSIAERVRALAAELGKPVASRWQLSAFCWVRDDGENAVYAECSSHGWGVWKNGRSLAFARGPETGDAGRHAADLVLVAAGYRLVGGVHPLPDEVKS